MGSGASAGEGRYFCHRCGARTSPDSESFGPPKCGACGATEGVEATDPRLPATATTPTGVAAAIGAVRDAGVTAPSQAPMRVESVTVVALHRPEDGGLLLRVMPNVMARRDIAPSSEGAEGAAIDHYSEDWGDVPSEPASSALVSRLEARHCSKEIVNGESRVCVICADELQEAGVLVVKLSCGHTFHDGCIRKWLTRQHTCPTCRLELEVDDVRYLRSIGLADEADALEKVQRVKQEEELVTQAAARRRWVDSMRRGVPVHFGLTCSRCGVTPLVGECHRCIHCEGYFECCDCSVARESRISDGILDDLGPCAAAAAAQKKRVAAESERREICGLISPEVEASANKEAGEALRGKTPSPDTPAAAACHVLAPFGTANLGVSSATASGLAFSTAGGPGGAAAGNPSAGVAEELLTVLVRTQNGQQTSGLDQNNEVPGTGEAAAVAAEVAFAAVRSLALAPLAGAPPLSGSFPSLTTHGAQGALHSFSGLAGGRWAPHGARPRNGRP